MWKENLYQPFEVLVRQHTHFPIDEHQHSFFEMAYVREGKGDFYVDDRGRKTEETMYGARSLFLIPPDTVHRFIIREHSAYVFIRFTSQYAEDFVGRQALQALNAAVGRCRVLLDERQAERVANLFCYIEEEVAAAGRFSTYLVRQWLNSIVAIVADYYMEYPAGDNIPVVNESERAMCMMQYLQQHINQPEMLTSEVLGERFNIAPSYVGAYFKHHFREDLREYVVRNRLRNVERLLANTSMTVKEIAASMGYTDSSHLIRQFRACHNMSPLDFRRSVTSISPDEKTDV